MIVKIKLENEWNQRRSQGGGALGCPRPRVILGGPPPSKDFEGKTKGGMGMRAREDDEDVTI